MTEDERNWLDRAEGYIIYLINSNPDALIWVAACEMMLNFIKQERCHGDNPLQFVAVPVGYEPNGYVIHPYSVTEHAEE